MIVVLSIGSGTSRNQITAKEAANLGGIQWFNKLLTVMFDESLVEQQTKLMLKPNDYIRINSNLKILV